MVTHFFIFKRNLDNKELSAVDFEAINSKQYIVTFGLVTLKMTWDDVLLNTDLKPARSRYFLIGMATDLFAVAL